VQVDNELSPPGSSSLHYQLRQVKHHPIGVSNHTAVFSQMTQSVQIGATYDDAILAIFNDHSLSTKDKVLKAIDLLMGQPDGWM
jgi:hypothetical protein